MGWLLTLLPGGRIFSAVTGFLTSTVGLVLIASILAYIAGHSAADKRADLARLNAEIATLKADQKTSESARQLAERQANSLEVKLKSNQEKVNALEADLKKRPAGSRRNCALSGDDAERLRHIR